MILFIFANFENGVSSMELLIAPLAKPFEFKGTEKPTLQIDMIHGFTASPTEVKPLGEYLFGQSNKNWLIRSILLPGHGIAGEEGYKALDHVSYNDWKNYCVTALVKFSEDCSCPIILVGLSMGALLAIRLILTESNIKESIKAGVLLSPALYIQGKFFPLVKILKFFIKYQKKGFSSETFFETYNLFSYKTRSLHGVDEFRKLMIETTPLLNRVTIPLLTFLSENDDLVDIPKTIKLLKTIKNIEFELNSNLGHILTVYPESREIFSKIYTWIEKLELK